MSSRQCPECGASVYVVDVDGKRVMLDSIMVAPEANVVLYRMLEDYGKAERSTPQNYGYPEHAQTCHATQGASYSS